MSMGANVQKYIDLDLKFRLALSDASGSKAIKAAYRIHKKRDLVFQTLTTEEIAQLIDHG